MEQTKTTKTKNTKTAKEQFLGALGGAKRVVISFKKGDETLTARLREAVFLTWSLPAGEARDGWKEFYGWLADNASPSILTATRKWLYLAGVSCSKAGNVKLHSPKKGEEKAKREEILSLGSVLNLRERKAAHADVEIAENGQAETIRLLKAAIEKEGRIKTAKEKQGVLSEKDGKTMAYAIAYLEDIVRKMEEEES